MINRFKFGAIVGARKVSHWPRLLCEELERRWLPSTFLWCPPGADTNYHTEGNWAVLRPIRGWVRTDSTPVNSDDIVFAGTAPIAAADDDPVTVNTNIGLTLTRDWDVHSAMINPSYTSVITLQNDLALTGADNGDPGTGSLPSILTMPSATITGTGGKLVLGPGAKFDWSGGTLRDLTVLVEEGGASAYVKSTGAGSGPLMLSSTLDVRGLLFWESEDVNCGRSGTNAGPSAIHVRTTGSFSITAADYTWGTNSNDLIVTNRGLLFSNTKRAATLNGSYSTYGRTIVSGGTLQINGDTEQSEPQAIFALVSGTIKPNNQYRVLGIRDGKLIGTGTVDGNLHFGNGNGSGSPIIAPGDHIDIAPGQPPGATVADYGQINVTENFHMFAGTTRIDIDGTNDTFNPHDFINVQGYAVVTGTLVATMAPARQEYPENTKIIFLHTTGGRPPTSDYTGRMLPAGLRTNATNNDYWLEPVPVVVTGRLFDDGYLYFRLCQVHVARTTGARSGWEFGHFGHGPPVGTDNLAQSFPCVA